MLCDAGPLIALIDRTQPDHVRCRAVFDTAPLPLISTWPCLTEAMHLLNRIGGWRYQQHLWEMHARRLLTLHAHDGAVVPRITALMEQYRNVPMDLADASLVVAAETTNDRNIFTLDADFRIYRFDDGGVFQIAPS